MDEMTTTKFSSINNKTILFELLTKVCAMAMECFEKKKNKPEEGKRKFAGRMKRV